MKQTVWVPIHGEFIKDKAKYTDEELLNLTPIWIYPFFFFDEEKAKEALKDRVEEEEIRYVDKLISYTIDTEDKEFHGHLYVITMIDSLDPEKIIYRITKNIHGEKYDGMYNEDAMYKAISADIYTAFKDTVKSSYSCESMYNKRDGSRRWIIRNNEENRILRIYDCHCVNPMCELEDVFDMIRL